MIDMRYKPYNLPQVHAPYDYVLEKLDEEDVSYSTIEVDPNELKPMQGIVISDEVGGVTVDDNKPIWLSNSDNVCDGHHRWVKAMLDGVLIVAIKINKNSQDTCRILNKIQDIYEYEEAKGLEEVQSQGAINYYREDENQYLYELEDSNQEIEDTPNDKVIVGYRRDPINDSSVVGNFFLLKPHTGFEAYEIEFENLLDTNELGISYKESQEPVEILAKSWFPNINFEKLSTEHGVPSINMKIKAVAEKAKKMGYDGIKYGSSIIQGLK